MSLKCKHSPQSTEPEPGLTQSLESETKKRGKEEFSIKLLEELSCLKFSLLKIAYQGQM